MAKTVKITTDNEISTVDIPWNLESWEAAIGADCVETVKTQLMLDFFGGMVVMIVDESGLCKGLPKNSVASFLYGSGCPIAGDVIFGVLDAPDILPPDDAEAMMQKLKFNFRMLSEKRERREMTVKQAASGGFSRKHGTYNIGFINDAGSEDETQFDNVKSIRELQELFSGFCKENGFPDDTVLYVEKARTHTRKKI